MCPNIIKPSLKSPLVSISNVDKIPKLYVGNLPKQISSILLRKLFTAFEISHTNISICRNFAFVKVSDRPSLEKAIETLNGYNFNGSTIIVEPAGKKNSHERRLSILADKTAVKKSSNKQSNISKSHVIPIKRADYPNRSNIPVSLGKKKASKTSFRHNPFYCPEPVAENSNSNNPESRQLSLQSPVTKNK